MYLCKQYLTTITISFIIIITVLEAKLINNIKQSNDHRVIIHLPTQSLNTPVFKKTSYTHLFITYKLSKTIFSLLILQLPLSITRITRSSSNQQINSYDTTEILLKISH